MNKKSLFCLCAIISLTSCGNDNTLPIIKNPNFVEENSNVIINIDGDNEGKVFSPNEVTITETLHSIEAKRYYNTQVLPSIGDVNLLIIPVLIPGYETINNHAFKGESALNAVREDLEKVFFSDPETDGTSYESVSSYYKKSSFGKLNLSGKVTPWFNLSLDSDLGYVSAAEIDVGQTEGVVKAAVNWAKDVQNIDMTKYDNDQDGYIDGVWLIYSAPNYTNYGPVTDGDNYWAYTAWGNQTGEGIERPSKNDPVFNLYGWASYDFMYESGDFNNLDSHTYIHETGHFLGLNDYYTDASFYNPIGKVDMMDANIGEHNAYSKMLLGWTKPYLVSGDARIQLNSMHYENNVIVIQDDSKNINGEFDPFDEYIVIELYSNEGLTKFYSEWQLNDRPLAPKDKGVRIYHVDNRKFLLDFSNYEPESKIYEGETLNDNRHLILPITNKRSMDVYNYYWGVDGSVNLYDEIRLIQADGQDTFSNGGWQKEKTLFKKDDVFTIDKYKNFFVNGNKFNNGNSFTKKITIEEIN